MSGEGKVEVPEVSIFSIYADWFNNDPKATVVLSQCYDTEAKKLIGDRLSFFKYETDKTFPDYFNGKEEAKKKINEYDIVREDYINFLLSAYVGVKSEKAQTARATRLAAYKNTEERDDYVAFGTTVQALLDFESSYKCYILYKGHYFYGTMLPLRDTSFTYDVKVKINRYDWNLVIPARKLNVPTAPPLVLVELPMTTKIDDIDPLSWAKFDGDAGKGILATETYKRVVTDFVATGGYLPFSGMPLINQKGGFLNIPYKSAEVRAPWSFPLSTLLSFFKAGVNTVVERVERFGELPGYNIADLPCLRTESEINNRIQWKFDVEKGWYYIETKDESGQIIYIYHTEKGYIDDAGNAVSAADIKNLGIINPCEGSTGSALNKCLEYISCLLRNDLLKLKSCIANLNNDNVDIVNTLVAGIADNSYSPNILIGILHNFEFKYRKKFIRKYNKIGNIPETLEGWRARNAKVSDKASNIPLLVHLVDSRPELRSLITACLQIFDENPHLMNPSFSAEKTDILSGLDFKPYKKPVFDALKVSNVINGAYGSQPFPMLMGMGMSGGYQHLIQCGGNPFTSCNVQAGGGPPTTSYEIMLKHFQEDGRRNGKILESILKGTIEELKGNGCILHDDDEPQILQMIEEYKENEERIIKLLAYLRAYAWLLRTIGTPDMEDKIVKFKDITNKDNVIKEFKAKYLAMQDKLDKSILFRSQSMSNAGTLIAGLNGLRAGVASGPVEWATPVAPVAAEDVFGIVNIPYSAAQLKAAEAQLVKEMNATSDETQKAKLNDKYNRVRRQLQSIGYQ